MKIAVGQMKVAADREENLATVADFAQQAVAKGARMLVLPEGIIARDPENSGYAAANAEPIDGYFVKRLKEISAESALALICSVHVKQDELVKNVFLAIDGGELINKYEKLHPFDAFNSKESDSVTPGDEEPEVFEIDGVKFGGIICYDVRFPELSISLALRGAEVILCPAAWVTGPLKEQHWASVVTARALDTTSYVVGCGEISKRNVGRSLVVDPLGVTIAGAGVTPALFTVEIDSAAVAKARMTLPILENRRFAVAKLA